MTRTIHAERGPCVEAAEIGLELISRGERSHRPALLFVHGAFHDARCWDHHFLPWFADQGWECHALSLRGHGASPGDLDRDTPGLEDYLADIDAVMSRLGRPVVLIGHSMGGVLAQMARARAHTVAGTVLLASSPLRPATAVVLRLLARHPLAFLRSQIFGDMNAGRRVFATFFHGPDLAPELKARYLKELSGESGRAAREVFSRRMPETASGDLKTRPVLVVAGHDDWSIPLRDHQQLARALEAPLAICPGAHDLMLDPAWEVAARAIHGWLMDIFAPTCGSQHPH